MPYVISPHKLYIKKSDGSGYLPVNAITGETIAEQIEAIEEAGETQSGRVASAGNTQVGNVNSAGSAQVAAVQAKGEQTLASIPSDYTNLSNDVTNLKSALSVVDDEIYGIEKATTIKTYAGGNLLNPKLITDHLTFMNDGTPEYSQARGASGFINVEGLEGKSIYNTYGSGSAATDRSWAFIYAYVFYGADKETVVYSRANYYGNNFPVPTGAYWLRVSAPMEVMHDRMMVYVGTGKVDYAAYSVSYTSIDEPQIEELWDTTDEINNTIHTVLMTTGKNFLNPDGITEYTTLKANGTTESSQARALSDFINVNGLSGTIYNTYGSGQAANDRDFLPIYAYCFYQEDKTTVVACQVNYNGNNFPIPSGAYWLRVSAVQTAMKNRMMTYVGTGKVDYEAFQYVPMDRQRVIALEEADKPIFVTPTTIWGVVGHPFSVYFYNIFQLDSMEGYHVYVDPVSSKVQNLGNRIRFSCTTAESYTLTLSLRRNETDNLQTITLNVVVVAESIPSVKAIIIGDSFVDGGYIQAELMNKMGSALTLYGTRDFQNIPDSDDENRSGYDEGRYGWRLSNYWNDASKNGVTNAFFDGTSFNFPWYIEQHPSFSDVTDIFILSGANDAGWGSYNYVEYYKKIVNSIKTYSANIRIHALIPLTCCCTGYGFGIRSDGGAEEHRYQTFALANALISQYKTDDSVILTPIHVDFDYVNDFPHTEVAASDHNPTLVDVYNDNVHPNRYGYYGIANTIFSDIVANCQP